MPSRKDFIERARSGARSKKFWTILLQLLIGVLCLGFQVADRGSGGPSVSDDQFAREGLEFGMARYWSALGRVPAANSRDIQLTAARRGLSGLAAVASESELGGKLFPAKSNFGVKFGRWWPVRPSGLCLAAGCPCSNVPTPCFEQCDQEKGCADLETGESPKLEREGFATALEWLGPVDRTVNSRPHLIVSGQPRRFVLVLDVSESILLESAPAIFTVQGGQRGNGAEDLRELFSKSELEEPQPAGRLFDAVSGFIEGFREQRGPLDELFVIIYDTAQRGGVLRFDLNDSRWKNFEEAMEFRRPPLNTSASDTILRLREEYGIIPRKGSGFDLIGGLETASRILRDDRLSALSSNQIVLFTAGLPLCQRSLNKQSRELCSENDLGRCSDVVCADPNRDSAQDAYASHSLALQEALEVTSRKLSLDAIPVHVFIGGAGVTPHTTLVPSPSTKSCFTETDMRIANYAGALWEKFSPPEVDANKVSFEKLLRGEPAHYVGSAFSHYALARRTGGTWQPLRESCPPRPYGGLSDLSHNGRAGDLDDYCSAAKLLRTFQNQPAFLSAGSEALTQNYLVQNSELIERGITDSAGRLLCEPTYPSSFAQARALYAQIDQASQIGLQKY